MQITDAHTSVRSLEKFTSEVDVAAVWCPDHGNYDLWICQLLCCLIGSGSIHNELFQLLSAVCCIKVHKVQFLFSTWLKCNYARAWWVFDRMCVVWWTVHVCVDKILGVDATVRYTWHSEIWYGHTCWRCVSTDWSILCQSLRCSSDTVTARLLSLSVSVSWSTLCCPQMLLAMMSFSIMFAPRGPGHSLSPFYLHDPVFCSFLLFHFLSGFNYFLLLSTPFLSTRIVPLHFQAGGLRKQPHLGLVCCVYFVLSVFFS